MTDNQQKMGILVERARTIVDQFRPAFSRRAAFDNFRTAIIGFLVADEMKAVTDLVRYLDYPGDVDALYERMIKFFRASSYSAETLLQVWLAIVAGLECLVRMGDHVLLAGDGVKIPKSGRQMAAVKKMHQQSESASKREYVMGHMYGTIGALAGDAQGKAFYLPIETTIQDGCAVIESWKDPSAEPRSHVVRMMEGFERCMEVLGKILFCLDRYFFSLPAIRHIATVNAREKEKGSGKAMVMVCKARRNAVAYHKAPPESDPHKRGPKRRKGESVKVGSLFELKKREFVKKEMLIYGGMKEVEYYCTDLLWGLGEYVPIRFVLVKIDGMRSILTCTSDEFTPEQIITAYSLRWKTEQHVKDAKYAVGTFSSHFWSLAMPRLNRFLRKGAGDPLASVTDEHRRRLIIGCFDAFGRMAMMGNIAQGILQLLAIEADRIGYEQTKYLRTRSQRVMSEDTVNWELRKEIKPGIAHAWAHPIPALIERPAAS